MNRNASTVRWTTFLALADAMLFAYVLGALLFGERTAAALMLYPALSLLAVTALYALEAFGRPMGTVMAGRSHRWLWPLLFPFRSVAWSLTVLMRILRGKSVAPTMVAPGLWLGMRPFDYDARTLEANAVFAVVDLCAELPPCSRVTKTPFERLAVPVLDRCAPDGAQLDEATLWISERISSGKSVYVHCAFGRGRSAMVAAAALLRMGNARDADDALAQLRRSRPSISVKGDQYAALSAWSLTKRDAASSSP